MNHKKKRQPGEFSKYTSHYPKKDDTTPFVTLWVNVSTIDTGSDPGDGTPYSGFTRETEKLEECGVSLGSYLGRSYADRSCALTEEHLGFMPERDARVFMVIEDYASGGTFGNTEHNYRPVKIFKTRPDAHAWLETEEAERCKDDDYFGGHNQYLIMGVVVE